MAVHWSKKFPGDAAASWILGWLEARQKELDRGESRVAREALLHHGWRHNFDLNDVPAEDELQLARIVDIAADALRDPLQMEAAQKALRNAAKLVRGG